MSTELDVWHGLRGDKQCECCKRWYTSRAQFTIYQHKQACVACVQGAFRRARIAARAGHPELDGTIDCEPVRCMTCGNIYGPDARLYHDGSLTPLPRHSFFGICYACAEEKRSKLPFPKELR